MKWWCLSILLVGLAVFGLVGCDQTQFAGPVLYRDSERIAKDLGDKPQLQAAVRKSLAGLFGDDVRHLKVPAGSGLRDDGFYLADHTRRGDVLETVAERDPANGKMVPIAGGYALYRKHCLHCHGVFGAGDGPTAYILFPRPRDYRPGVFKFTSTNPTNAKPTRDDLRKTILQGLHGTSMPGFEATMTPGEVDQVIDYMVFLSIRGETERGLIDEAMLAEDKDAASTVTPDLEKEVLTRVASSWKDAESQVVNPSVRRVEANRESVLRGREYFLGLNKTGNKAECVNCHGANGKGNGPAFIEDKIFGDVVFREKPLDEAIARAYRVEQDKAGSHALKPKSDPSGVARFLEENPAILAILRKDHGLLADVPADQYAEQVKSSFAIVAEAARKLLPDLDDPDFRSFLLARYDLWVKGSLDDWGNPLRPANLLGGLYKGGRRPLDLYWRIAKGINGAKMPAHSSIMTDDQIWDVVNFVLALPDDPGLLREPPAKPTADTHGKPSVAASH